MSSWQGGPQWTPGQPQGGRPPQGGPQRQQGGQPPWGQPPAPGGAPDWNRLAADADRRRQRRRLLIIAGAATATLAIGAVVALGIVRQSGGGDEGAKNTAGSAENAEESQDPAPEPSFEETSLPPVPKPREFITDADKDLAPFAGETFFSGDPMEVDGRTYVRRAVADSDSCVDAVDVALGEVLTQHGCTGLARATYSDGIVAVTIGVAQFPGAEEAEAAKEAAASHLSPLTSGEAPAFCARGGCRTTKNQVGRYAYFTIAGNADNTPDQGDGTPAQQAARDGNAHAHARIVLRGEDQASESAAAIIRERNAGGDGEED
ncbi:hypothetical protein [Streptomyces spiramenti]|uniref:Uncharacterized protein n=1 Tax=Streptomyces spiramenti TaxID=2720606 RepID=A0ABX1ATH4_9ACTN|nr:hypothetical protein [Streptomyces spiramenti]NJP67550.1 hypothetical protein [Streptomyces spiramenti]